MINRYAPTKARDAGTAKRNRVMARAPVDRENGDPGVGPRAASHFRTGAQRAGRCSIQRSVRLGADLDRQVVGVRIDAGRLHAGPDAPVVVGEVAHVGGLGVERDLDLRLEGLRLALAELEGG